MKKYFSWREKKEATSTYPPVYQKKWVNVEILTLQQVSPLIQYLKTILTKQMFSH